MVSRRATSNSVSPSRVLARPAVFYQIMPSTIRAGTVLLTPARRSGRRGALNRAGDA
jgi:hypothetical protein